MTCRRVYTLVIFAIFYENTAVFADGLVPSVQVKAGYEALTEDSQNYISRGFLTATPSKDHQVYTATGMYLRVTSRFAKVLNANARYYIGAGVDGGQQTQTTVATRSLETVLTLNRAFGGLNLGLERVINSSFLYGADAFVGTLVTGKGEYKSTYKISGIPEKSTTFTVDKGRTLSVGGMLATNISNGFQIGIAGDYRWYALAITLENALNESMYATSGYSGALFATFGF